MAMKYFVYQFNFFHSLDPEGHVKLKVNSIHLCFILAIAVTGHRRASQQDGDTLKTRLWL